MKYTIIKDGTPYAVMSKQFEKMIDSVFLNNENFKDVVRFADCPFCGKDCSVIEFHTPIGYRYRIACTQCTYSSMQYKTRDEAIAAHNRVAKKCMEVR